MGSKFKGFKVNHLNLTQQKLLLSKTYPTARCSIRNNVLCWEGQVKPTPISGLYGIRVDYHKGLTPKVYVKDPLKVPEDEVLPHVYSHEKQQLCLYYPKYKEWSPCMFISQTIIPWVAEWLMYYELWLATGRWLGGGIHDKPKPIRSN